MSIEERQLCLHVTRPSIVLGQYLEGLACMINNDALPLFYVIACPFDLLCVFQIKDYCRDGIFTGGDFTAQVHGELHFRCNSLDDAGAGDIFPLWTVDCDLPVGSLLKRCDFQVDAYPAVVRPGPSLEILDTHFIRGQRDCGRVLKEDIHHGKPPIVRPIHACGVMVSSPGC